METVKVLVRVRPVSQNTNNSSSIIQISPDNKSISIDTSHRQIQCRYDHIFGPKSSQSEVYSHVQDVVAPFLRGYNGTIFAYGQTGSGKSHSMFGVDGNIRIQPGIVPRCIRDVFHGLDVDVDVSVSEKDSFRRVLTSTVYVSFLQVYNEQVFDMFDKGMIPLNIREKEGGIVVSRLIQCRAHNVEECISLIEVGLKNRAIRETTMNHASSRSHSILQIVLEQDIVLQNNERKRVCSKLNLVDLAGSERWGGSGMGNEQISELTNINSSLYTLGRCIAALAKNSRERDAMVSPSAKVHVPYRDSKLTRLLQDSLGGNAKTCLLATVNPSTYCGDESICTLRFADRAHQVMTHAKMNESVVRKEDSDMSMMREEIKRLQQLIHDHGIIDPRQSLRSSNFDYEKHERPLPEVHLDHLVNGTNTYGSACSPEIVEATGEIESKILPMPPQNTTQIERSIANTNAFDSISAKELSMIAALGEKDTPLPLELEQDPEQLSKKSLETIQRLNQYKDLNISMPHNDACKRIIDMVGSVLSLVDAFLNSVVGSSFNSSSSSSSSSSSRFTNHAPHHKLQVEKGLRVEAQLYSPCSAGRLPHDGEQCSNRIIDATDKIQAPLIPCHRVQKDNAKISSSEHDEGPKTSRTRRNSLSRSTTSTRTLKSSNRSLSSLLNKRKKLKGKLNRMPKEEKDDKDDEEVKLKQQLAKARKKKDKKVQLRNWFLEKEKNAENPFKTHDINTDM